MTEINKPSDINKIWASAGDVLAPSDSKISTGWAVEIPPRQWFNYIDHKQDQAIAHINQHGIPVWDNTTEYQWSSTGTKSICMGSDGTIYRTKQVSVNQNPVTDTTDTYWEIAFANNGDFYTQTQSDARYLQKSANLSDLVNPATARTNLSVYSQAQTYTKSEVQNLIFGVGQSWLNMTANRNKGVTYTNTTGRTIALFIKFDPFDGNSTLYIDGHNFPAQDTNGTFVSFVIPPGGTYSLSTWGTDSVMKWLELR